MIQPVSRIDLTDSRLNGLYRGPTADLEQLAADAVLRELTVARMDLAECRDKDDLLGMFAQVLHFPPEFGRNWDALGDCMNDLQWLPTKGHAIILQHAAEFAETQPEAFQTLCSILAEACDVAHEDDRRLFILLAESDKAA